MQEKEFSLKDMLCYILREWRKIIVFALAVAILFGTFVAITRGIDMKDPKKTERWEAEHEVARNAYWAPIYEIDRKILENERLAAEAKAEIEKLTDKKAEHEAQITDAQAKIAYYEALIEDYKAGIEQLRVERTNVSDHLEHRRQHNADQRANILFRFESQSHRQGH
jgi:chromosome segregation ATPase